MMHRGCFFRTIPFDRITHDSDCLYPESLVKNKTLSSPLPSPCAAHFIQTPREPRLCRSDRGTERVLISLPFWPRPVGLGAREELEDAGNRISRDTRAVFAVIQGEQESIIRCCVSILRR